MEILKKIGKVFLAISIVLLTLFISIVILMILTDIIMVDNDYLFYEHDHVSGNFLILLIFLPAIIISLVLLGKLNLVSAKQKEKNARAINFWRKLGYFKFIVIMAYVFIFYICFTNITVVTEDKIIVKSPFNPGGRVYAYSDVDEIEVGFGDKFISCNEYEEEGNFYYKIKLGDKNVVFYQPTVNDSIERYNQTSYLEILDFDTKLKLLNVKKTAYGGAENSAYDEQTLKILLLIINN